MRSVGEHDLYGGDAADHVRAGEDAAVVVEHEAGARGHRQLAPPACESNADGPATVLRADGDDARRHVFVDLVGVQPRSGARVRSPCWREIAGPVSSRVTIAAA